MLDKTRGELRGIFALVKTPEEMESLLDGLLTPAEMQEFVNRWRLMQRLLRDEPQRQIARELGVSLGTIARGSRLLKYGPGRFRRLVERSLAAPPATP